MTPEIDHKTYLPISVWFWQYQALFPTIGWMWWWHEKPTIEARTRFQCKLNDALELMKFIDEHSFFIHHFKSSFIIFTFHPLWMNILFMLLIMCHIQITNILWYCCHHHLMLSIETSLTKWFGLSLKIEFMLPM